MDQFEAIFNKIKEHCSKLDRNMLLDKLALDGRVVSALKRANVRTIGDLLEKGADGVQKIRGIGIGSCEQVEEALDNMVKNQYENLGTVCPHCGAPMTYFKQVVDDVPTHIWICDDCPNVLFEFYGAHDLEAVRRFLKVT